MTCSTCAIGATRRAARRGTWGRAKTASSSGGGVESNTKSWCSHAAARIPTGSMRGSRSSSSSRQARSGNSAWRVMRARRRSARTAIGGWRTTAERCHEHEACPSSLSHQQWWQGEAAFFYIQAFILTKYRKFGSVWLKYRATHCRSEFQSTARVRARFQEASCPVSRSFSRFSALPCS